MEVEAENAEPIAKKGPRLLVREKDNTMVDLAVSLQQVRIHDLPDAKCLTLRHRNVMKGRAPRRRPILTRI